MDVDGKYCFGGGFGCSIVIRKNYLITGGRAVKTSVVTKK